mgnify:FL=1
MSAMKSVLIRVLRVSICDGATAMQRHRQRHRATTANPPEFIDRVNPLRAPPPDRRAPARQRTFSRRPRCRAGARRSLPAIPHHLRARGLLALTGACRVRHCACDAFPATSHARHNADTGQPPRYTAPVGLSRPRGRPPASHRRGRSLSIRLRATAPMGRRWTTGGGPEGRRSGTPQQRQRNATGQSRMSRPCSRNWLRNSESTRHREGSL